MFTRSLILATLLSTGAHAQVSADEKALRVEAMERLAQDIPMANLDVFRRELRYEEEQLPHPERARREANLMAQQVRYQVMKTYDDLLAETGDDATASARVLEGLENDLALANPELKSELEAIALEALADARSGAGALSREVELEKVEAALLPEVEARAHYLNEVIAAQVNHNEAINHHIIVNSSDALQSSYRSKQELLQSMVSDRDNTRWLSRANQSAESASIRTRDTKVSLNLKWNLFGTGVEGGPAVSFTREYISNVKIIAEGLTPIFTATGAFDHQLRDARGQVKLKDGRPERRFIAFFCETSLRFASEASANVTISGGVNVLGTGVTASGSRSGAIQFSSMVQLTSRRLAVPETVAGQTVTMNYLQQLCHRDFLTTRLNRELTVAGSLNQMMRGVVSNLVASHPRTNCIQTSHCQNWFRRNYVQLQGKAIPRCVENRAEQFRYCQVRALENQKCLVVVRGEVHSRGPSAGEFDCDFGLRCQQTRNRVLLRGFDVMQWAEGKCVRQ